MPMKSRRRRSLRKRHDANTSRSQSWCTARRDRDFSRSLFACLIAQREYKTCCTRLRRRPGVAATSRRGRPYSTAAIIVVIVSLSTRTLSTNKRVDANVAQFVSVRE